MEAQALFPKAPKGAGMYESFYLRAVAHDAPVGAWIRYTVQKRPGAPPEGSLWCTVFDAQKGRPWMHRVTTSALSVPKDGWIAVGEAQMGEGYARGECGGAKWSLTFTAKEPELRHLPKAWMYKARLPRTKLTSPAPDAWLKGRIELPDGRGLELDGWKGMVGHNWGAEHAERWIWLHGVGLEGAQDDDAWLDVALGRIVVAGRLTPWIANGALGLNGERYRIGGLGKRGLRVSAQAEGCELSLPGAEGVKVKASVKVPKESAANWRYTNPKGGEHEVMNCSVAAVELDIELPGEETKGRLRTANGGAYELGGRGKQI
jgi:hypothetical protein